MSDEQAKSPLGAGKSRDPRLNHSGKARGSNKSALLLAGAAAVALLLGGGYYVWKNGAPSELAASVNTAPVSSPYAYDEITGKDATTEKAVAAAPKVDGQTTTEAQPQQKKSQAAAIPEETLGVSRVSARKTASASQSDEVVVRPTRRPVWRYTPRPERLSEYYPSDALERGREGEASLHCIIQKKGALNCERVSETPARAGFGAAALRVSRTLRHAEHRADGKNAIGTPLNLRVVFRMPEGERRG